MGMDASTPPETSLFFDGNRFVTTRWYDEILWVVEELVWIDLYNRVPMFL